MNYNIALIRNPASRLNQQEDRDFTDFAAEWLGNNYKSPSSLEAMNQVIQGFLENRVNCIIIDGGDGTISHVMTAIYHIYPHDRLPHLVVLPSGNTNLIAKDVGFGVRGIHALHRLKRLVEQDMLAYSVQHRHALKIEWTDPSRTAVLGMFQGAAAFTKAINIAHSPTILKNFSHDWAVGITIVSSFLKLLFPKTRDLWLRGNDCSLEIDGVKQDQERCFLFLATTLQGLSHGIWPFFSRKTQASCFHYLNIKAYPPFLLKACWALLRGRVPSWLRQNPYYLSGTAERIGMRIKEDIILDGEHLDTGKDHQVYLSAGPKFSFVRL